MTSALVEAQPTTSELSTEYIFFTYHHTDSERVDFVILSENLYQNNTPIILTNNQLLSFYFVYRDDSAKRPQAKRPQTNIKIYLVLEINRIRYFFMFDQTNSTSAEGISFSNSYDILDDHFSTLVKQKRINSEFIIHFLVDGVNDGQIKTNWTRLQQGLNLLSLEKREHLDQPLVISYRSKNMLEYIREMIYNNRQFYNI